MKAFISHSSAQKDFAIKIAEQIGFDQCIIDTYDFSPAYRTMDEIIEKMNHSTILVFLISQESLKSDWCTNEIRLAQQRIEQGKLKLFLPYIIDPNIDINNVREKFEWIVSTETYNLKLFRSPIMVARDLNLKFRKLEREKSQYRDSDDIFEGRNDKINEFQSKKSKKRRAKSLIISGRPGTGRKRFCQRCADDVGYSNRYFFETISLPNSGQLSDFIIQLNPITNLFSEEKLKNILRSEESLQLDAAVKLLNEIYKYQGKIRIIDNNVIVDYKSNLSNWFVKLVNHPDLQSTLGVFLISTTHIRANLELSNEGIIAIHMPAFSREDREKILTRYLDHFGHTECSDEDIAFFVDKLKQSPSQLVKIASIIATSGLGEAKRNVEAIRQDGDYRIAELLNSIKDDNEAIGFLTLLANNIGTISYDDIKAIYGDNYEKISPTLEKLITHSLVYEIGASSSLIHIDPAIGDYLVRTKRQIPKWLNENLNTYLNDTIHHVTSIAESPSLYIMRCKKIMEDGRFNFKDLLLPSIAINHMISLYHSGHKYKDVVLLCHQLLDDDLPCSLDDEVRQEILFWECLSLCHLQMAEQFYNRVNSITDTASKFFLKGFFKNRTSDYKGAISDFQQALKINPSMNKAKREIVSSYMHLKLYEDAFKYAKENYEISPDNGYHITAYFQCLLLKRNRTTDDVAVMNKLIEHVHNSFLPDKDALESGMKLLWKVRTPNTDRSNLYNEIKEIQHNYSGHKYIKDITNYCLSYLNK
ncbi:TIR domain-containing protein [bacterium]|nr:TIR domain-containing protein [bacterium]